MKTRSPLHPWPTLHSEKGPDLAIFKLRYDHVRNPRNGVAMRAVVLDTPDWVDIVAITPEWEVVMVDQHRFGVGRVVTEIPAGAVNPGETPRDAAIRELREETGYTADRWIYLGPVEPNSAFQNNRAHQWVAWDVQRTHDLALDAGEDIRVRRLSFNAVRQAIQGGVIANSLALLALSRVFNIWDASQSNVSPFDALFSSEDETPSPDP